MITILKIETCIHDNFCYLTIKSDSGQHSQFLRCFLFESPDELLLVDVPVVVNVQQVEQTLCAPLSVQLVQSNCIKENILTNPSPLKKSIFILLLKNLFTAAHAIEGAQYFHHFCHRY